MEKMKLQDEATLRNKFSGAGLIEHFSQVTVEIESLYHIRIDRMVNGLEEDEAAWTYHEELIHYKWKLARIIADRIDS